MINNAGLMPQAPLERLKIDEWNRMIDVNIKGVLYGIAAALPHMKQQKAGHFINVSSVAGHRVGPGFAVYAATKYAVRALSEGLRQEVKPYNIRTTVISPGAVATELPDSVTDPDASKRIRTFYEQVAVPADSFARAVAFAMSQPEDVDINEILYRPTRQELRGGHVDNNHAGAGRGPSTRSDIAADHGGGLRRLPRHWHGDARPSASRARWVGFRHVRGRSRGRQSIRSLVDFTALGGQLL